MTAPLALDAVVPWPGATAVSLELEAGSLTALLGQNGAGKTTLLDIATARRRPHAGAVRLAGHDIAAAPPSAMASLGLGLIARHTAALPGLTALEQVCAGFYSRRAVGFWSSLLTLPAARRAAAAERHAGLALLERVGLAEHADRPAATLRAGELKRLDIARALAAAPRVLLLDEPAAGLRAEDVAALGALLHGLRAEGLALLVAEHSMAFVAAWCDRAIVLHRGRVLADGPPQACLDQPDVQEALLGRQQDADRLRTRR